MLMPSKKERQIVYNSVLCLACGDVLVSYHRHDYKTCGCDNQTMVDGGTAYLRYGGKDMTKLVSTPVFLDEPFEKVRHYATRGARGKDGKQPLTWIPISQLTNDHLQAILEYGGADWHLNLISQEIAYRKLHNIVIEDKP